MTAQTTSHCINCGAPLRTAAKFCSRCQQPVPVESFRQTVPLMDTIQSVDKPINVSLSVTTKVLAPPRHVTPNKSSTEDLTQILPGRSQGFSLLPVGAIIGEASPSYVVLKGEVSEENERHSYLVQPWSGTADSARYVMSEMRDAALVDRSKMLASYKLAAEGLLLPVEAFQQTLWEDAPRGYVIYQEKIASNFQPASQFSRPQSLDKVLGWGATLATGLQTLHDKRFAHSQINPQNILVRDDDACLTGFENLHIWSRSARDQGLYLQRLDVAALATSLYDLLGGLRAVLPPDVRAILQQAQGKDETQTFASAVEFGRALSQARTSLSPVNLSVKADSLSHEGQVRKHNEDKAFVQEVTALNEKIALSYGIYIVADGMGGHEAGEVASNLAVKAAMKTIQQDIEQLAAVNSDVLRTIVERAGMAANQVVYEDRTRRGSDMGTTLVFGLRIGNRLAVGNLGDSRAYLINASEIRTITVDHSLVQRLIDTNQITPDEARTHPQRNLIYKVVGDKPDLKPDVFDIQMRPGDRLLLCSDGLWEMVEDRLIWQTVLSHQEPGTVCEQLINLANQAGGEDNITALLVQAR